MSNNENTFSDIPLIPLQGKNIEEHFYNISKEIIDPYVEMLERFLKTFPPRPKKWIMQKGWIKYDYLNGKWYPIDSPNEDVLIFDVETSVPLNSIPIMATALSSDAWYSWTSEILFNDSDPLNPKSTMENLISFHSSNDHKRLFIGHNVSFDRTYIKQQYHFESTNTYFLDTLSLHIAVSGFTTLQKGMYIARRNRLEKEKEEENKAAGKEEMVEKKRKKFLPIRWMEEGCLYSLNDVYCFYCGKNSLNKHLREAFVQGDLSLIRENFQVLMKYCSDDVMATARILNKVWPIYKERFPHPSSLAGMFEMGISFLPVNSNWFKYITRSQQAYEAIDKAAGHLLNEFAEEAVKGFNDESYKQDLWLWDLDWSQKKVKAELSEEQRERILPK